MKSFIHLLTCVVMGSLLAGVACEETSPKQLPYLGIPADGEHYIVPAYTFLDQDSVVVSEALVEGKIHVVDFFFTSCPDICPKMNQQMLRVHDTYLEDEEVLILSHTLDPQRDTVEALREFSKGLGIQNDKWKMLSSRDFDYVFEVCKTYMVAAGPGEAINGGIFHSGKFVLLDKKRRIRGFYEGTDPQEVDMLISDIAVLKNEQISEL